MTPIEQVAQKLKSLGIGYTSVEHPQFSPLKKLIN